MDAPGKGILKTVSILFVIFGAIVTIVAPVGLIGSAALSSVGGLGTAALGGILIVAMVLLLIVSVLELILGILGIRKSGDPNKAGYFITVGIVLSILSLASMAVGIAGGDFSVWGLIGFVLPVLYIIGGIMNKRGAVSR